MVTGSSKLLLEKRTIRRPTLSLSIQRRRKIASERVFINGWRNFLYWKEKKIYHDYRLNWQIWHFIRLGPYFHPGVTPHYIFISHQGSFRISKEQGSQNVTREGTITHQGGFHQVCYREVCVLRNIGRVTRVLISWRMGSHLVLSWKETETTRTPIKSYKGLYYSGT